ncbi:MAG: transposase, partial [Bacteroidetes bacterium]|nr:transposase [Bacteroidota bacterium]
NKGWLTLLLTLPEDIMAKKIVPAETPTLNLIAKAPYAHTDANLDTALQSLKPASVLKGMGFKKRSGDSIEAILYTLFLMPLLHLPSIYTFFDNGLSTLIKGSKDVVYDFMKNQSINWSLLTLKLALTFSNLRKWGQKTVGPSAFVVDDTLDRRCGRKVEATSLHWDHNLGKSIHGHQFLQLGFASSEDFLPLIGHLFVGRKKRSEQPKLFNDKRNAVAKSYHDAHHLNKH